MHLSDVDVEFRDVETDRQGDGAADIESADGGDEANGGSEGNFKGDIEVTAGSVEGNGSEACFIAADED